MRAAINDRLRLRVSHDGASPLITYYDLRSGERTELSAVTFANWVAKTANLLDELGVAPRDAVRLDIAAHAPGHWITYVWAAACWQVGAVVAAPPFAGGAALIVVGPDWAGYETSIASDIVACALRPLGQPFWEPLPAGVLDYAVEVRRQADRYAGSSPSPPALAWLDDDRQLSATELAEIGATDPPARRLVRPTQPWPAVAEGLLTPLNSGGSTVVVVGDDEDEIARIAASERVDQAR
jgi:uncharacterized protein (TIGR03089 family)